MAEVAYLILRQVCQTHALESCLATQLPQGPHEIRYPQNTNEIAQWCHTSLDPQDLVLEIVDPSAEDPTLFWNPDGFSTNGQFPKGSLCQRMKLVEQVFRLCLCYCQRAELFLSEGPMGPEDFEPQHCPYWDLKEQLIEAYENSQGWVPDLNLVVEPLLHSGQYPIASQGTLHRLDLVRQLLPGGLRQVLLCITLGPISFFQQAVPPDQQFLRQTGMNGTIAYENRVRQDGRWYLHLCLAPHVTQAHKLLELLRDRQGTAFCLVSELGRISRADIDRAVWVLERDNPGPWHRLPEELSATTWLLRCIPGPQGPEFRLDQGQLPPGKE